jgi:hypothetical protein
VQPHQEIVDWFDASEHIWTVAKALYGDDTPETKGWAKTPLIDDDATGYQLLLALLAEHDEPRFTMLETIPEYGLEQLESRAATPSVRLITGRSHSVAIVPWLLHRRRARGTLRGRGWCRAAGDRCRRHGGGQRRPRTRGRICSLMVGKLQYTTWDGLPISN